MSKETKTTRVKSRTGSHAAHVAEMPQGSSKRQRPLERNSSAGRPATSRNGDDTEDLVFEDPFGDEFEAEESVEPEEKDAIADDCVMADVSLARGGGESTAACHSDGNPAPGVDGYNVQLEAKTKVWRAGVDKLAEGERLDYDSTAYHMYHSIHPEWPCLSFDVIRDSLGMNRSRFPHTIFAVAGTQADRAENNRLQVMKLSDLHRTAKDPADSDSGDDDDQEDGPDETDDDPILDHVNIPHRGGVNRVRSMPQRAHVVATWSETSELHVWDLEQQVAALEKNGPRISKVDPALTFTGHTEEGFALAWSQLEEGTLASGDCGKCIYVTRPAEGGWVPDQVPFIGHEASVEDLQWSPTENTVFASGSADKTVAFWDVRQKNGAMLRMKAHDEDVNVISWNGNVTYLLASGSDDGSFKIWDLRTFGKGEPVAQFRWHQGPITSIEWHPTDESMLAASGADNQLSVWDLSVEADDEAPNAAAAGASGLKDLPPQLLFIHQGQTDIKELHFHPQIPGVILSTAADGFNIFKPATTV